MKSSMDWAAHFVDRILDKTLMVKASFEQIETVKLTEGLAQAVDNRAGMKEGEAAEHCLLHLLPFHLSRLM